MYKEYFRDRGVDFNMYKNYEVPKYLACRLGGDKNIFILDIGCGFGQFINGCKKLGYKNIKGIDLSEEAVKFCKQNGMDVEKIDVKKYLNKKFDVIYMGHILEHLPKNEVINTLWHINTNLLNENGSLFIMVPNAQSNTDCYWAYEDFTHNTLFTAGSLLFVLKEAGFKNIEFLDIDGTSGSTGLKKTIKKYLLKIYIINKLFWNKVTGSYYHQPSPMIFTWELKCVAKRG